MHTSHFRLALLALLCCLSTGAARALDIVHRTATAGEFQLADQSAATPLFHDAGDDVVVATAAAMYAGDIFDVTGQRPSVTTTLPSSGSVILAGTLGHSALIDALAADGRLATADVAGRWETFGIALVDAPADGISRALVVYGSDARGTAFGLMHLSRLCGVSPLVYWADARPAHQDVLTLTGAPYVSGEPSVRYRGIFINDEDWGLHPWARDVMDPAVGSAGPNTYERVFQLLLRLKANYLWPAMHGCSKAFWTIEGDAEMARRYGIVMGSSHCEQMLCDNVDEWKNRGDWNWKTNSAQIADYWTARVRQSKDQDAIYTLGMRGIHDSGMPGYNNDDEKAVAMRDIISRQRDILEQTTGRPANTVPQLYCPYKEALKIYRKGIDLPSDVTLLWADDNYGYIRQLSDDDEMTRTGGGGVYYHFSYWGGPQCWLWLSSSAPALTWMEMMKAYERNCKTVWVFNVGDIKPQELETCFALDFAWDVHSVAPTNPNAYVRDWAEEVFGADLADAVNEMTLEYYALTAAGKPEFEPNIAFTPSELRDRMARYDALVDRVEEVSAQVPDSLKDAYFQLVTYPVCAAAAMQRKVAAAALSFRAANFGNQAEMEAQAAASRAAYSRILDLTDQYNNVCAGGKWHGMMSHKPLGEAKFDILPTAKADNLQPALFPDAPTRIVTDIRPGAYARSTGDHLTVVNGLGDMSEGLVVWPLDYTTYATPSAAPSATYRVHVKAGDNTIAAHFLPSFPVHTGLDLRYAIAIDAQDAHTASLKVEAEGSSTWSANVVRGYALGEYSYTAAEDKDIDVTVYFLDPGLVLTGLRVSSEAGEDFTAKIQNPSFELNQQGQPNPKGTVVRGCPYGWSALGEFKGNSWGINADGSNIEGDNLLWVNSSVFPADFRLYQDIDDLPSGVYTLRCRLAVPDDYTTVRLFANQFVTYYGSPADYGRNLVSGEVRSFAGYAKGGYNLKDISVTFMHEAGEPLRLGIATSNVKSDGSAATDHSGWYKVDGFHLTRTADLTDGDLRARLTALVATATQLADGASEGNGNGQYATGSLTTFRTAIADAAQQAADNAATCTTLALAYTTLSAAIDTFRAAKHIADSLALSSLAPLTAAHRDAETGLVKSGHAEWAFSTPVDLSDFRYLVVPVTRTASNQSSAVYVTDEAGHTISGEGYTKLNGTEYKGKGAYDLMGGKMWLDRWNNMRVCVIDLTWLADRDKNLDGSDCAYIDTRHIAAVGVNASAEGVYLGEAFVTNRRPNIDIDYRHSTVADGIAEGDLRTVCLPYDAVCCGADSYEVASATTERVSLVRTEGLLAAGHAYILRKTATQRDDSKDGIYLYRTGNAETAESVVCNGLVGALAQSGLIATGAQNYALRDNEFHYVDTGSEVTLAANRAYLDLAQVTPVQTGARARLSVALHGGEATAITAHVADRQRTGTYDLAGRRLRHAAPHSICVIDGKKTAVR